MDDPMKPVRLSSGLIDRTRLAAQGRRFADEAYTTNLHGCARRLVWDCSLSPTAGAMPGRQLALPNQFDKSKYLSSHLHVSRWPTPARKAQSLRGSVISFIRREREAPNSSSSVNRCPKLVA